MSILGHDLILGIQFGHDTNGVVMAEDFQNKYVGLVAIIIASVVFLAALVGMIINFY